MIAGLIHRCTISTPTGVADDALGQPAPTGYTTQASDIPCRLSSADADQLTLLLGGDASVAANDRITDITQQDAQVIDAGPFAVHIVEAFRGRATIQLQRLQLERLTAIDQD